MALLVIKSSMHVTNVSLTTCLIIKKKLIMPLNFDWMLHVKKVEEFGSKPLWASS
jgi:hypothetical protein